MQTAHGISSPCYVLLSPNSLDIFLHALSTSSHASLYFVDSARLLGELISSSSRLVLPYVPPILRALLLKLRTTTQLVVLQSQQPAAMPKGPAQPGNDSPPITPPPSRRPPKQCMQKVCLPGWQSSFAEVSGSACQPEERQGSAARTWQRPCLINLL